VLPITLRSSVVLPNRDLPSAETRSCDPQERSQAEADIVGLALAALAEQRLPGNYDLAHWQVFHRRIFGALYPWAGELRTVQIAKPNAFYAHPEHITGYAQGIFVELAREDCLKGLDRAAFLERLTHYHAEMYIAGLSRWLSLSFPTTAPPGFALPEKGLFEGVRLFGGKSCLQAKSCFEARRSSSKSCSRRPCVQTLARIVTAYGNRKDPPRWTTQ
jgi:hypothetical protein